MKNPCAKTSVFEVVFNEIAGINARLAPLMKKVFTEDIYL